MLKFLNINAKFRENILRRYTGLKCFASIEPAGHGLSVEEVQSKEPEQLLADRLSFRGEQNHQEAVFFLPWTS